MKPTAYTGRAEPGLAGWPRLLRKLTFTTVLILCGPLLAQTERVSLTLKGEWVGETNAMVRDLARSGHLACLAVESLGVLVIDISDPTQPRQVGEYPGDAGPTDPARFPMGIAMSGRYAYVGLGTAGLRVLDLVNPAQPRLVGSDTNWASDIALAGHYAYVAARTLKVIDISNPTNPQPVAWCATSRGASEVALSANLACVLSADDDHSYLDIIDITDPTQPVVRGTWSTHSDVRGLAGASGWAYVGDENAGLVVLDLTDPLHPRRAGTYSTGDPLGVTVQGRYAYLADGVAGLKVIDVANPANPRFMASSATKGRHLAVAGEYVYVTGWGTELRIYQITAVPLEPLDTWQWRSPLPQGNDIYGLAWHDSLNVAVGDYGTVLTAWQGDEGWTVHSLESNVVLRSVTWGNGKFVAVGSAVPTLENPTLEDVIVTSPDDANWTLQTIGDTNFLQSIAWGDGRFVAVGSFLPWNREQPHIFSSPDGVSWTPHMPETNPPLNCVTRGEPGFVAVGGSTLHYSADGLSWHSVSAPLTCELRTVTYGNGRFVALGASWPDPVIALVSTNGLDWILGDPLPRPIPGDYYIQVASVAYGNGRFLAIGRWNSEVNLRWISTNGLVWTLQPSLPALQRPTALLWTGSEFVAAGEFGNLAVSTDGENWTLVSRATSNNLRGTAYGNDQFVAIGNNGTNLTSPDGIAWTSHAPPTLANLHDLVFAESQFVAAGSGGVIVTSSDGATWAQQTSGTSRTLFDVTWGNGTFVAVGGDRTGDDDYLYFHAVLSSPDGTNWTTRLSGGGLGSYRLHGVTFGNGQFVAVGGPHGILTSTDGATWTRVTNGVPVYLKGVACGNGRFVAVGESATAWVSSNGVDWEAHLISHNAWQLDDVEYGEGIFVAVGDSGQIFTSTNGVEWAQRHSPTTTNLRGLTFGRGTFLIVGNNDTILQSQPPPMRCSGQMLSDGFELTFLNAAGWICSIEVSTNLSTWTCLTSLTNLPSGGRWLDSEARLHPRRFYRAVVR